MTLTTRLAIAMIALVAITVGAVAWLSHRSLEQEIVPRVLDRIEAHSRFVAGDLATYTDSARADIVIFRDFAAVIGMMRARLNDGTDPVDHVGEAVWRERLEGRLAAQLAIKPAYARLRYIGVADGGHEIVRVDRSGPDGAVRAVPEAELPRAADAPYFRDTLALGVGGIYVSPVELDKDAGAAQPAPILRVATPVPATDGKPFGIILIEINMRGELDRTRSSVRTGETAYVVDSRGNYLVHPDRTREFGGQTGSGADWRRDFPYLASAQGTTQGFSRMVEGAGGRPNGVALAPALLVDNQWIAVIETVPNAVFMAPAATIRNSSIVVGLLAVLAAAGLAILIARSLMRPIRQLTAAVESVAQKGTDAIPVDAPGETGVLARAFVRVISEVNAKTVALEREVVEHLRTEAARDRLAGRERLFSAAVESSNDAVITQSLDGIVTGWNPAAERLFGYAATEAVGRHVSLIVPPDRAAETDDVLRRISSGETIANNETVRLRKDGTPVEVSLSISPIKSASGAIIGICKTARDMTESRKAQENLRESEQLARGIINSALDAFVQIDQKGIIRYWNPQAESLFGWPGEEALGKNVFELLGRPDGPLKAALGAFLHSGGVQLQQPRREVQARRRDGTEFTAELSIAALKTRDGFVFNGFVRDLTDKIAAEERMRQAEKMEAVGQLTGGIAHDFNNILTVITGTIEILADAVKTEPQLAAITKMIDEAAARGAELTQHLLAFARKQPLDPREIDVNLLIVETTKLLQRTLGEHVEIESIFEDETCLAIVDPNQLVTAILNLALNARDAMPDGGKLVLETGTVFLDETYARLQGDVRPGRYAMIAVSDTGTGIPSDIIDKVFNPFFTSKGPGKGTGLGLSMVYGFIKQSAGHIKIYSEEGHGTTVKMYLPPATSATATIEPTLTAKLEGGNETILVVEDDKLVRDYVLTQLHSLGYVTLDAANAADALAITRTGKPFDLLFTDVIMPGMNGRQLAEEIHKLKPDVKVLFTSGYTENAIIHHGRLDEGVLLLAKPYRKSDMAIMIRKALAG
ncbi:PAS domain S-box protein [Bradyrhizobium neotropicale]|uniref:PAS domain S-box protein n=1 Tax=Bradyrhizobium neotropicale TaxID=1497615 RepID=UPI001AD66826|nr:PAS domain S-box protein [Bradyrhizobium neotropicale]MBO4227416.1 PAS domain S-box protein [Bradyrhizobium neotropicale]